MMKGLKYGKICTLRFLAHYNPRNHQLTRKRFKGSSSIAKKTKFRYFCKWNKNIQDVEFLQNFELFISKLFFIGN